MGLVKAIKDTFLNGSSSDIGENPKDNPYYEAVCARIPVDVIDEKTVVEFRWIKNKETKIKGAYAVFLYKGEQVPVLVSAPNSGSFSVGINIGFSKILYPSLKEELQRLKNEGLVSERPCLVITDQQIRPFSIVGRNLLYLREMLQNGKISFEVTFSC